MSYIFDINEELILAYTVVKNNVEELIEILKNLEAEYLGFNGENRERFYKPYFRYMTPDF